MSCFQFSILYSLFNVFKVILNQLETWLFVRLKFCWGAQSITNSHSEHHCDCPWLFFGQTQWFRTQILSVHLLKNFLKLFPIFIILRYQGKYIEFIAMDAILVWLVKLNTLQKLVFVAVVCVLDVQVLYFATGVDVITVAHWSFWLFKSFIVNNIKSQYFNQNKYVLIPSDAVTINKVWRSPSSKSNWKSSLKF